MIYLNRQGQKPIVFLIATFSETSCFGKFQNFVANFEFPLIEVSDIETRTITKAESQSEILLLSNPDKVKEISVRGVFCIFSYHPNTILIEISA